MTFATFSKYESAVRKYQGDPQSPSLRMAQDGAISMYYAPFEWVNPLAKVVLVGITPGRLQADNALAEAKRALTGGFTTSEVLRQAKQTGAFSGAMRPNLIALLDYIGLQQWLGLRSCGELFGDSAGLLQTASVLQFPVYVQGKNYNGTPDPVKHPLLRALVAEHFGSMAKALPDAIFVPLGPVPSKAIEWLASQGHVPAGRVLHGLPHPSGANAERISYFLGRKARAELSAKTDANKLDTARERLIRSVASLGVPAASE